MFGSAFKLNACIAILELRAHSDVGFEDATLNNRRDAMAFNNVGALTFLAQGQTASWNYSYPADHGTQFASADVKTPNQGAVHLADQQRKRKDNNGNAAYFVNITNQGPGGAFHNLQGGGMS
jgi:hypothetical protein